MLGSKLSPTRRENDYFECLSLPENRGFLRSSMGRDVHDREPAKILYITGEFPKSGVVLRSGPVFSQACFQRVMRSEQANLIKKSFDEMWPIRRGLAMQFYNRFFEIAPDAKRLFPSNMERLYLKLMDTIAAIVGA